MLIFCSLSIISKCVSQDTNLSKVDGDDLAQLFEGEDLPPLCNHIGHSNNATLRGGINSGTFIKRENATSFDDCIEECCRDPKCDVAFELEKACYSVYCFTAKLCEVVPNLNSASTGSVRIAQVIHGVNNNPNDTDTHTDLGSVQPTPNPKHMKTEKKTQKNVKVDSIQTPTVKNAMKVPERQRNQKAYRKPGTLIREKVVNQTSIPTDTPVTKQGMTKTANKKTGKQTPASIQTFKPVPKETKSPISITTKKQSVKQTIHPNKPLVKQTGKPTDTPATKQTQATQQTEMSTTMEVAKKNKVPSSRNRLKGNNTCVFSRVAYNQTIVGGTQSWQSIDLGDFIDLHDCAEKCCRTDNCMVAAVRENKCFAVECLLYFRTFFVTHSLSSLAAAAYFGGLRCSCRCVRLLEFSHG